MSSELRVDRILPVDGAPTNGGGSVIQVVTATKTDAFTTTTVVNSTSDVTGLSINITPKFATSKIMICSMISAFVAKTSSYNAMGLLFLVKNSTRIASTVMKCRIDNAYSSNIIQTGATCNFMYLDSPGTTSSVNYHIEAAAWAGNTTVYINGQAGGSAYDEVSTLTAMEISA